MNTVGQLGQTALQPGGIPSQTINTLGQTVTRTLDATGNIVESILGEGGQVLAPGTSDKCAVSRW